MGARHWTEPELATLRDLYGRVPVAEIVQRLGRTVKQVYLQAYALGLTAKYPGHDPRERQRRYDHIRRRNAEGATDVVIAAELGLTRTEVSRYRRRLGIPASAEGVLAARRRAIAVQLRKLGVRHGGDLRKLAFTRFAVERGWPADLRPRAVQILEILIAAGEPLDRPEIARRCGMPWKGSRKSLVSNDPEGSYLANLVARGLVVILKRAVRLSGGRSRNLYAPSPAALEIAIRRTECRSSK